ncbi:thp1 [Candida theae]|uniref:Thp1 n=1 Tax=Candida theae TaxID=1198502 RepID=A0AAD5FZZ4_9ASCO|nr:thp1 [Candida theae]KAI5962889.1 thp1 [Candida theae]
MSENTYRDTQTEDTSQPYKVEISQTSQQSQELKSIIHSFKHNHDVSYYPNITMKMKKNAKISKNPQIRRTSSPQKRANVAVADTTKLPDLRQSLSTNLDLLFIGFNPGVQSSIQQHHYAHHSNLFWKLFNKSKLLEKVLAQKEEPNNDYALNDLLRNGCSAKDDFELIKYGIGFTDLALRCTATAAELTAEEKLNNIPRLIHEINFSGARNVVLVGKGIWEMIVKHFASELKTKLKLTKDNFRWGKIAIGEDAQYNRVLKLITSPSSSLISKFSSSATIIKDPIANTFVVVATTDLKGQHTNLDTILFSLLPSPIPSPIPLQGNKTEVVTTKSYAPGAGSNLVSFGFQTDVPVKTTSSIVRANVGSLETELFRVRQSIELSSQQAQEKLDK